MQIQALQYFRTFKHELERTSAMQRGHSSPALLRGTQQKFTSPVLTVGKTAAGHCVQGAGGCSSVFHTSGSANKSDLQHIIFVAMMQTTEDAPAAASGSSFGTLVQTLLFGVSAAIAIPTMLQCCWLCCCLRPLLGLVCEQTKLPDGAIMPASAAVSAGQPPACADLSEHTLRLSGPSLTTPQAASRLERGRATCLRCQGSGTASCPSCKVGRLDCAGWTRLSEAGRSRCQSTRAEHLGL